MKRLISIFFFFICSTVFAQITDSTFFSDTISGNMSELHESIEVDDGVIISGYTSENFVIQPYICKIDKTGDLVWTTLDSVHQNINYSYLGGRFEIELFEDGFIYGRSSYLFGSNQEFIWKVNASTGIVIYKTLFYKTSYHKATISDYDSTKFLMTYHSNGGWNANSDNVQMAYMNKATGDTISTHFILPLISNNGWGWHGVQVDANKNIYFYQINQLCKLNKGNPNEKLWTRTFTDSVKVMNKIMDMYLDNEDNLFLFGSEATSVSDAVIIKVDVNTGKQIWNSTIVNGHYMSDFVDRYGKLYVSYEKCCVGGGYYFYYAVKVDKNTGNVDWFAHELSPNIQVISVNGYGTTFGIDVDCNKDVYFTGHHGNNFETGEAAVIKVDGNTGLKIYLKIIPGVNTAGTGYSTGEKVHVFENSPLVLAELQTNLTTAANGQDLYKSHSVAIDMLNGDILNVKPIGGERNFISKTIDVIKQGDSLFVFKQVGKFIKIELFNNQDSLLWSRTINDTTFIQGGQMAITPNYVYISSKTNGGVNTFPYDNGLTQKIKLFQVSRQIGSVLNKTEIVIPNVAARLLELKANDASAYVFYTQNSFPYSGKWTPGSPVTNISYTVVSSATSNYNGQANNVIDLNPTTFLVIGNSSIVTKNKTNFNGSSLLFTFPNSRYYNDYTRQGDTIFMVGKTSTGNKLITAYSLSLNTILWEQTYGPGSLYRVSDDGNSSLAIAGNQDSLVYVAMINKNGGFSYWEKYSVLNQYTSLKLKDAKINQFNNSILLTGEAAVSPVKTDVFITELSYYGDTLWNYFGIDNIGKKSFGWAIEIGPDENSYIGGAFNHALVANEGVLFKMKNSNCTRQISVQYNPCFDTTALLTAWNGTSYQWRFNGVAIPSATSQSYFASQSGIYNCVVSDSCSTDTLIYGKTIVIENPSSISANFAPIVNPLCPNSSLFQLTGTPAGGVFSGLGVVGNGFNPQVSGEGQFVLTYQVTDSVGCISSDTSWVTVIDTTSATVSFASLNSIQINSINYTSSGVYQQNLIGAAGCDSLLTLNVTICNRAITTSAIACADSAINLTSWPGTSHQWYKNGIALLGATNQTLTVTSVGLYNCYVSDSCSLDSLSAGFNVNTTILTSSAVQAPVFNPVASPFCSNNSSVVLSALPAGGVYSGIGVSGTNFNPQVSGEGQFTLNYTVTDSNGCFSTDSIIVIVSDNNSSAISLSGLDSVQVNSITYTTSGVYQQYLTNVAGCDSLLNLNITICNRAITTSFVPCVDTAMVLTSWPGTNYQWYKNGVALAGETNQTFSTSSTGVYNCVVNDNCSLDSLVTGISISTILATPPIVQLTSQDSVVCVNDGLIPLIGLPIGGTYSGLGMVSNNFDPQTAGPGVYQLSYSYVGSNGCAGIDTSYILVNDTSSSILNLNGTDSISVNGITYNNSGIYNQTLIGQFGCDSLLIINVNLAFTGLVENDLDFRIFPNPVSEILNIEGEKFTDLLIEVYDMTGKLIKTKKHHSFHSEIDMSLYERGTYIIRVGTLRELIVVN